MVGEAGMRRPESRLLSDTYVDKRVVVEVFDEPEARESSSGCVLVLRDFAPEDLEHTTCQPAYPLLSMFATIE